MVRPSTETLSVLITPEERKEKGGVRASFEFKSALLRQRHHENALLTMHEPPSLPPSNHHSIPPPHFPHHLPNPSLQPLSLQLPHPRLPPIPPPNLPLHNLPQLSQPLPLRLRLLHRLVPSTQSKRKRVLVRRWVEDFEGSDSKEGGCDSRDDGARFGTVFAKDGEGWEEGEG